MLKIGNRTVIRKAGHVVEMNLSRVHVSIGGSSPQQFAAIRMPKPMGRHRHQEMYTALEETFPMAHTVKTDGIVITSFNMDRGGFNSLRRLLMARIDQSLVEMPRTVKNVRRALMVWYVDVPCAGHDIQGAYLDSLAEVLDICNVKKIRDICKPVFKAVRSLRESFSQLIDALPGWIMRHLHFDESPFNAAEVKDWWELFHLPVEAVTELTRMNLHFVDNRLHVAAACRRERGLHKRINDTLLVVFRFRKFSETRHACQGASCQTLVASRFLGLDSLVETILQDDAEGDWYLQCYKCFGAPERFHGLSDDNYQCLTSIGSNSCQV